MFGLSLPRTKTLNQILPQSFAEEHVDLRDHLSDGIYLLKNGDLGTIYSVEGIYDHPLDSEGLRSYFQNFYSAVKMMTSIPTYENRRNILYQVICSQRTLTLEQLGEDTLLDSMKSFSQRKCHEILKEEEKFYLEKGLVKRRNFLCLRYQVQEKNKMRLWSRLKEIRKGPSENSDLQAVFKLFQDFQKELKNFENRLMWPECRRMVPKEVLSYYQNVLNSLVDRPVVNNAKNLHESIFTEEIINQGNALSVGGRNISLYAFMGIPEQDNKLGAISHFLSELPEKDWDFCWNFGEVNKEFSKELTSQQYLFRNDKNISSHFDAFKEQVGFNHPFGSLSVRLTVYSEDESIESKIQAKAQEILGVVIRRENQILVHMIKTSLPLNCTSDENNLIGRTKKIRLQNALIFCPLYNGPSDAEIYKKISSFNTLSSFNLFAGEGNKTTSVLGMARAGKGVMLTSFYMEFLSRFESGVIRIIDKKTSSQKLADLIGGRIYRLSEDELRKNCFSPFSLPEWDDWDLSAVKAIILTTIIQKNNQCNIESLHDDLLRETLKYSYNDFQKTKKMGLNQSNPHMTWEDILMNLPVVENNMIVGGAKRESVESAKEDLVKWTLSFKSSGQYGFIFSSHETVREDYDQNRFVVYDLDGIADPVLQQIMVMMCAQRISREMKKLPFSTKKKIVFEELGMLVRSDSKQVESIITNFIDDIVKTCPKYNAQAVGVTNGVDDYAEKKAGITFWNQSTQKIFLPMTPAMRDSALAAWKNQFNEAEWQIFEHLHKNKRERYSMAFIHSKNEIAPYKGIIKIPLSPYMDALTTTSGSQMQLYDDLKNSGLSPEEALLKMAKDYPYGENLP